MPEYEFRIREEKIKDIVEDYVKAHEVPDLPFTSGEKSLMTAFATHLFSGGIILDGDLVETLDNEAAARQGQP